VTTQVHMFCKTDLLGRWFGISFFSWFS